VIHEMFLPDEKLLFNECPGGLCIACSGTNHKKAKLPARQVRPRQEAAQKG
jgi:hypothetical protein